MFNSILEKIAEILSSIHPIFLFSIVIITGMFVFWKGCLETRKDNSSIFDIFVISSIGGIILGRISHIISNWSDFSSYIWYWLPYEKYANEVFLFRVLPWRFFRVWDWGIDILLMFVGFTLTASLLVIFLKKWKWSHLYTTIYLSVQTMLAMSFILLGALIKNNDWLIQGLIMIVFPIVLGILTGSVKKIVMGKKETKIIMVLDIIFVLLSTSYISYSYMTKEITGMERGGIVFFIVWSALGSLFYILNSKSDNVTIEKVSSVRIVSPIDINQPIKLSK